MNRCRQISSTRSPGSSSTTVIAHRGIRTTYCSNLVPSGSSTEAMLSLMCGFSSTSRSAWIVHRVRSAPSVTIRGYRRHLDADPHNRIASRRGEVRSGADDRLFHQVARQAPAQASCPGEHAQARTAVTAARFACSFHGHQYGGNRRNGGRREGVWGNLEPGP
jgi:hypothetical protein